MISPPSSSRWAALIGNCSEENPVAWLTRLITAYTWPPVARVRRSVKTSSRVRARPAGAATTVLPERAEK